jgi:3-oxoacyl-[acyl-carrier-protein] synthase II
MRHDGRRVVITGLGLVTPLGNDLATNWEQLLAGRSGIRAIGRFDATQLPVRIAGEVRNFDPSLYVEKRDVKKMDAFTLYAVAATQMALDNARLKIDVGGADRIGVIVGVGMGGIATLEEGHQLFLEGGARKL